MRRMKMPEIPFLWEHFLNSDEPGGIEEMRRFGQAIVQLMKGCDGWGSLPQVHCFYVEGYETLVVVLISPRYVNKKNLKKIEKWCIQEIDREEEEQNALDDAERRDRETGL